MEYKQRLKSDSKTSIEGFLDGSNNGKNEIRAARNLIYLKKAIEEKESEDEEEEINDKNSKLEKSIASDLAGKEVGEEKAHISKLEQSVNDIQLDYGSDRGISPKANPLEKKTKEGLLKFSLESV